MMYKREKTYLTNLCFSKHKTELRSLSENQLVISIACLLKIVTEIYFNFKRQILNSPKLLVDNSDLF